MKFQIVAAVVLLGALGAVAYWRSQVADEAESTEKVGQTATQAMAALNQADVDIQKSFPQAMSQITTYLVVAHDSASAGTKIAKELLPKMDAYLAVGKRALGAADAYMARLPMPDMQQNIEKIRRRIGAFAEARDSLAKLAGELQSAGTTAPDIDKIASQMSAIAAQLMLSSL